MALLGPFLATPPGSSKFTSNDLPGPSEIHQGLGPYGPGCSYATVHHHGKPVLCSLVEPDFVESGSARLSAFFILLQTLHGKAEMQGFNS